MATTDTNLSSLVINKLTRSAYDGATKSETELYATTDGNGLFLGTTNLTPINNTSRTNCITEIPQDINLTLSDGTLTLKSGSKVYVPNGFESDGTTKKFDVVTISSDLTCTASINESAFIRYQYDDLFADWAPSHFSSGTSVPSGYNGWYYDTTANTIAYYTNGTKTTTNVSFPLGIATSNSTQITSIDQVFNGFGYIGSTVFALPGVKGLIPNGRNSDGSLKSTEFIVNSVKVQTNASVNNTYFIVAKSTYCGIGNLNSLKYDEEKNQNTFNNVYSDQAIVGLITYTSGTITSFTPKTCFHALDYNDKGTIAGWGMPSSKYIDLTLGSSGSTYTAPANGWVYFAKNSTATGQRAKLYNKTKYISSGIWSSGTQNLELFIPVSTADVFYIYYTVDGTTNEFKFIYAEGEK